MIYLFNPETDLALANGAVSYTPPARIVNTISRLALLPALYAPEGSEILVRESSTVDGILRRIADARCIKVVKMSDISCTDKCIYPWGWNLALRNELVRAGINDAFLPTKETLSALRNLSHRRTSITINRLLGQDGGLECFTIDDAVSIISKHKKCVIKSPWSSSGRGIWMTHNLNNVETNRIIKNVISAQGSVLVEQYIDKKIDCATEWICTNGNADFKGLSVFNVDIKGTYSGNIISSQNELRESCPEITDNLIEQQRIALETIISPHYDGPLGIDMMVSKDGKVIPCVEVNLRMTMGHVALELWKNFGIKTHFSPWNGLDNIGISF